MNKYITIGLSALALASCSKDAIEDGTIVSIEYFPQEEKVTPKETTPQTQTATDTTYDLSQFNEFINGPAINYPVNTIGNGRTLVYQYDIFADAGTRDWNFEPSNLHGYKVAQTFINNAIEGQYTLKQTQAPLKNIFETIANEETLIVTASASRGGDDINADWVIETTQNLVNSNALLVRSIENFGDDGETLSSGPVVERIYEMNEGLDQTLFVGVFDTKFDVALVNQQSYNSYEDEIIFVTMDRDVDGYYTTSHATPKLAAYASQLLNEDPSLTPQELKEIIMSQVVTREVRMAIDSTNGTINSEYRTIRILEL